MKLAKIIGLFVSGFVLGGFAVGLYCENWLSRTMTGKQVDLAFTINREAEWLAMLRLNQSSQTIKDMEDTMDLQLLAISQWSEAGPPDEKTRLARDKFLTAAKIYYESYPATGADAARINALLATVPGRSPQSTCKSSICQLDDLHHGVVKTNSP